MRTFNEIYAELKHYSAFRAEPSTESEAITSTNVFFAELALDDDTDTTAKFTYLVECYRHTASQFILNWKTETRTFKEFLESIYECTKIPFFVIDSPKGDYSNIVNNHLDDWQSEMVVGYADGQKSEAIKALNDHGRVTFKGHRLGVDGILSSLPIIKTKNSLMNNDKKMAEGTLHQDIKAQYYPNMKQRKSS